MADRSEIRGWDELIPDALGLIFRNLSLHEVLTVIPSVCKSWHKTVMGPYCWQEIDIEEWSSQWPEHVDNLLQMLILRSCGSLRKLCASCLYNDSMFPIIADNASALRTLKLPRSTVGDSMVEQIAPRLSTITKLDLSYCTNLGARALEAIGKHCKSLVELHRNVHPFDISNKSSHDDEAHAIATTMPKLRHLEMAYLLVSTSSVLEILNKCPDLDVLDLRGCWDVKLDDRFLSEKYPNMKVFGPIVVDYYEALDWEAYSDFSDTSEYAGWDFEGDGVDDFEDESSDGIWDDEETLEELELRFYEGHNAGELIIWPPTP